MWVVAMPLFVNFSPDQEMARRKFGARLCFLAPSRYVLRTARVSCASLRLPDTYSVLQESAGRSGQSEGTVQIAILAGLHAEAY
jgi:hypothetical protein